MLGIIMQYSLVELVVNGTAAQKIDNQLAKQSFPVLNWNIDGSSTTFAKNDNCVPHRLCDQPKKNETLRMWETTPARFPIGFLIFYYPGLLWEYWKLSMRRGSHLEYNIHGTADFGKSVFSVHTIPDS